MPRLVLLIAGLVAYCLSSSVDALADQKPKARKQSERFSGPLREPPDRVADALHLRLEVSFDWERSEVRGKVTQRFRSLKDNLGKISLDAVAIDVKKVIDSRGRSLVFDVLPEKLEVQLTESVPVGDSFELTIEYRCQPKMGVYFRKPSPESPDTPQQIWTQGEVAEARHWIPCIDHPVDRLTTEMIVTAPANMLALSNGKLVGTRETKGGKVFHWKEQKEHTTYLIAIVVGDFATYRDEWNGIPIVSYVPKARAEDAERSFKQTADMMEFFSTITRFPYPWEKYSQVCVHEFPFGGMENTTLTTLTTRTLQDENAALYRSSVPLVAHELAHQWFGDLVTCKDWGDLWLNESFATFFENQYTGHLLGWDEEVYERKEQADSYLSEDRNEYRRPLSTPRYREPEHFFDSHSYPKGARILAMLMQVVGRDAFYRGIELYLKRNAFRSVETSDFRIAMEEATGRSLGWFFEQWVFSGGHPEYDVSYEWEEDSRTVRVMVKQRQILDAVTKLFRMPVDVEITTPSGRASHRVTVGKQEETFSFSCEERPRMVRFDRDDWVLKELSFRKSREELLYQLENDTAMMGRLRAATGLGKLSGDEDARAGLLRRLKSEPFWGVRVAIASALEAFSGDKVPEALISAYRSETDARVRARIVVTLRELSSVPPSGVLRAFLREVIAKERSYVAVAQALRTLGKIEKGKAVAELLRACDRSSDRDTIRDAAMATLRSLSEDGDLNEEDKKEAIRKLMVFAAPKYPIRTRVAAIRALAKIGKGSDEVYRLISRAGDDQYPGVRNGAYLALGEFGDDRAIKVLKRRRGLEVRRVFRDPVKAIDTAIAKLEKGDDENGAMRKELKELREKYDRLEKRLGDLESKK